MEEDGTKVLPKQQLLQITHIPPEEIEADVAHSEGEF